MGRQANALDEASVALLLVEADRLAKIGVIGFKPVEKSDLIGEIVSIRGLRQGEERVSMSPPQLRCLSQLVAVAPARTPESSPT